MNANFPDTAVAAANAVRRGDITPTQLVEHALQRMEETRDLNAIAYMDAELALREAEVLTEAAKAGEWCGPLHGVPVTVKDLYNVRGMPTKAGTRAPLPQIEPDEAVAVARWRAAGAIVVAKTNMVEIALGVHGENAWTGDVKTRIIWHTRPAARRLAQARRWRRVWLTGRWAATLPARSACQPLFVAWWALSRRLGWCHSRARCRCVGVAITPGRWRGR